MEIKEIDLKERTITIFNDVEEDTMATAIEKSSKSIRKMKSGSKMFRM